MSPIIDLQRRLTEVGRIRMGEKSAKGAPTKRETWRLTSRDRLRIEAAQTVYPGEVRPWNDQYELLTETPSLRVLVVPGQTLSQYYEMWSGGGCQRRCDGAQEIISEGPCLCPPEHEARTKLAAQGKACKPTTRLSVLLPDVPGIGCWRLETHGFYSAVELAGIAELVERATSQGIMLPARLRIDQRSSIKGGQTRRYPVAVLEVDVAPDEVLALAQGGARQIEGPSRPALPPADSSPSAGVAPARAERGADGDDAGPGSHAPHRADLAAGEVEPGPTLSESQRRYVFRLAREHGMDEDALRDVIQRVTGQTSTAAIPVVKYEELKAAISA